MSAFSIAELNTPITLSAEVKRAFAYASSFLSDRNSNRNAEITRRTESRTYSAFHRRIMSRCAELELENEWHYKFAEKYYRDLSIRFRKLLIKFAERSRMPKTKFSMFIAITSNQKHGVEDDFNAMSCHVRNHISRQVGATARPLSFVFKQCSYAYQEHNYAVFEDVSAILQDRSEMTTRARVTASPISRAESTDNKTRGFSALINADKPCGGVAYSAYCYTGILCLLVFHINALIKCHIAMKGAGNPRRFCRA